MQREDIIQMAREAGINYRKHLLEFHSTQCDGIDLEDLERFAQLVAAKYEQKIQDLEDLITELKERQE